MKGYAVAYRIGFTPWERYGTVAASSIAALLEREEGERLRPPGRALDLGCGRGLYTRELARRGWEAVGIDCIPRAIDAASRDSAGARFVVGDVTAMSRAELGSFGFFLDVGCFQGLTADQRLAAGRCVTALAEADATLLMLAFGSTGIRGMVGGVSPADVEVAFPGWRLLGVAPAETAGLGWPMSKTSPQWYRLGRR